MAKLLQPKPGDGKRFALDASLLIITNGLAGLLFMLVHFAMGRMMSSADYAVLVSLLGLLNILNVPSSAVRVVLARYVAEYAHGDDLELWVTLVKRAFRRLALYALAGLVGWFGLSLVLPAFFDGYTTPGLWMLGAAALTTLFAPIVFGTLQGAHLFGWLALTSLIAAGGRLVLSVLAVELGGGVTAVLAAVAGATFLSLIAGFTPFRRIFATTPHEQRFDSEPIYRYLWPVLAGQLALFVLLNADLILSVRLLEGETLRAYSKAAMLSRTVLFLPLPVAVVMFPRAVNSSRRIILFGPILFTIAVSLVAALTITIAPGIPMKLMYNVTDPLHNELAQRYVWAVVPLALSTVLAQYLWARHRPGGMLVCWPIILAYVSALQLFASTPSEVMGCLAVAGLIVVTWLACSAGRILWIARPPH